MMIQLDRIVRRSESTATCVVIRGIVGVCSYVLYCWFVKMPMKKRLVNIEPIIRAIIYTMLIFINTLAICQHVISFIIIAGIKWWLFMICLPLSFLRVVWCEWIVLCFATTWLLFFIQSTIILVVIFECFWNFDWLVLVDVVNDLHSSWYF